MRLSVVVPVGPGDGAWRALLGDLAEAGDDLGNVLRIVAHDKFIGVLCI